MKPIVSIIVIAKNEELSILRTIESLRLAKKTLGEHIEIIFKDGESSDQTINIVQTSKIFNKILTGPDDGIYDAMTIASKEATGLYLMYINAGDEILPTIKNVILKINKIIYVKAPMMILCNSFIWDPAKPAEPKLFVTNLRSYIIRKLINLNIYAGMPSQHGAILYAKQITTSFPLNSFNRAGFFADYAQIIKVITTTNTYTFLPDIVQSFSLGGISTMIPISKKLSCAWGALSYADISFPKKILSIVLYTILNIRYFISS